MGSAVYDVQRDGGFRNTETRPCAQCGRPFTVPRSSKQLNCSPECGVTARTGKTPEELEARAKAIIRLRDEQGMTWAAIGRIHGISKARASQIAVQHAHKEEQRTMLACNRILNHFGKGIVLGERPSWLTPYRAGAYSFPDGPGGRKSPYCD